MERALPRITALLAYMAIVTTLALGANYADFVSYMDGGQRLIAEGSPYSPMQLEGPYPLPDAGGGGGFVYPPTSLWLFLPFAWGTLGGLAFNLVGALLLGIVVLAMLEQRGRIGWWAVPALIALAISPPLADSIRVGQVATWLAAGMGIMWLATKASGWMSVISGLVKIYPGAGLLWAWRHRAPLLLPSLAGLLLAAVTAVAWPRTWAEFLTAWTNAEAGCPPWALPSFACAGVPWLGYLLALVMLGIAWKARSDEVAFLALGLAMLVPAPDVYVHYLLGPLVAALPLALAGNRLRRRNRGDPAAAAG